MRHAAVKHRKQRVAKAKAYRFCARLNEEQRVLIQKGADFEGRTVTDFVLRSAEAAAERILQDRHADFEGTRD